MGEEMDFEKIDTLIKVVGSLKNETPLRVGRPAVRPGEVDLAVEKDFSGNVYIPGSSLKGAFRAFTEVLARTLNIFVCNPFSKTDKVREDNEGPCVICRIFGGGGLRKTIASHVVIYDAKPKKPVKPLIRTRVAIDRFRQAARSGSLFTYEYVPPNVLWDFKMYVYNIDIVEGSNSDIRVKLLRSLLKHLRNQGIHVGSMKSVGLGLIKLHEDCVLEKYVLKDLEFELLTSKKLNEVLNEW